MSQRRDWTDPQCPVARAADLIGDRWSLLIVRDAFDGARRFTEFQRNLGMARNILSDRLRTLVDSGILASVPNATGTRAEYRLTARGRDLFAVIVSLRQWAERNAFPDAEPHSTLIDDATGQVVPMVRVLDRDGAMLDSAATHVERVPSGS
ncbi:winged helix-turn-helix transcriptional regulator [Amycolatopsis saalfeldensis]|uniref:DNA-binding transcriptional regulator, HxlR family n=1 Tax=Amycolatopsis saalfeldensis TaxID=394193 RepID=A0A1H8RCB7_9PSEU|nr:helix-turn-helix domain-containing protein [Amycolatopsis saalfeldensis]SEO63907.1 DNA-binding transcriptional regulator, HxlR family [Amycolatopsis saalfeldensis]